MQTWIALGVAIGYVAFLFAVAFAGDRRARGTAGGEVDRGRPLTYALSLAIYCTSWTFFGSVGLAATSGLDFLGIYLGPVLALTVGHRLVKRIVRVARSERITSVADFLAARYGKSSAVGALAALIALVASIPYVALQLKAVATSVLAMEAYYLPSTAAGEGWGAASTAAIVAVALALFAVLFGTRHADATEHQSGLVLAVATESVVKLVAFLAAGAWVVALLATTWNPDTGEALALLASRTDPWRLLVFSGLSFLAFLLLPRQFHVGVVENRSDRELATARWLFPLYLVLINLFVVPVALLGRETFGDALHPDLFVLALPLQAGETWLAALVFVGGLSAATAMVIVACVALAIMVSNNLVLPLILRRDARAERARGDRRGLVLNIRRLAIAGILALAYLYTLAAGGSSALASIGLLSFAAIAQLAPAFLGGLFWRRATALGALSGMTTGIAAWGVVLLAPTLVGPAAPLFGGAAGGPFGFDALYPRTAETGPSLAQGLLWSLGLNALAFVTVSLLRAPRPLERLQARSFVPDYHGLALLGSSQDDPDVTRGEPELAVSRYLGRERTRRSFDAHLGAVHPDGPSMPDAPGREAPADAAMLLFAERLLSSAVGAASAHLAIELLLRRRSDTSRETLALLDRASRAVQYNRDIMQTALDRVDQGIAVFDVDYRLSAWNRRFRELTGLSSRYGQVGTPLPHLAEAIEDACEVTADRSVERALVEQQAWSLVNPGGRVVEVEARSMPEGGLVVAWNDVTARVDAARALKETNAALEARVLARTQELTRLNEELEAARAAADAANVGKTRFLAAAGHDILQPLNAARLYASALAERHLAEGGTQSEENRQLARNIDLSLVSVEEILGAVLAMSKLDTGSLEPDITTVSVLELFERLEVEFRLVAREKGLKLVVRPNDLAVRTDAGLFYRLLQNLVSNAIKYTEQGSVTVDAVVSRDRLVFSVADTGSGIAREDRTRIFGEFTRLDAGKRAAGGLGLGLSIVRRIADSLGTQVDLQSRVARGGKGDGAGGTGTRGGGTKGGGTTFRVAVPLASPPTLTRSAGAAAPDTPSASLSPRNARKLDLDVLCLDNDPAILHGMATLLEGWGCRVRTVRDGAQARAAMRERSPHVLVADYHLDDATGLDVIDALRERDPGLRAVLLTAERSPGLRAEARSRGVEVLFKPLRPPRLRAVLNGVRTARPAAEPAQ